MNGTISGWIKLHRRFLDSPVWRNVHLSRFWVWCLLRASYQSIDIQVGRTGVELQSGQFLYTHAEASIQTGLSQKVARTCVETLGREKGIILGRIKGSKKSVLTILNWDSYQGDVDGEGREKGSKKGREMGSFLYKDDKKIKKQERKNEAIDVVWNGEKLLIPDVLMEKYRTKFPRLDIVSIAIDAERWLLKNPAKAVSYKSFGSFLNNWLCRESEKLPLGADAAGYEVSKTDAAIQLQFERDLAAGRAANA